MHAWIRAEASTMKWGNVKKIDPGGLNAEVQQPRAKIA